MTAKKTLEQREKELQSLIATPAGRDEIQKLASRYSAVSNSVKAAKASAITYILVYEREHGLLAC